MRFRILVVVIGTGSLWSLLTAAPVTDPEQEVEAPGTPAFQRPAKADEPASNWSKLDPSRLWREQAPDEPPPPDPLVHCRPGGDAPDTYLRSSECERRGGQTLEEPSWAKKD